MTRTRRQAFTVKIGEEKIIRNPDQDSWQVGHLSVGVRYTGLWNDRAPMEFVSFHQPPAKAPSSSRLFAAFITLPSSLALSLAAWPPGSSTAVFTARVFQSRCPGRSRCHNFFAGFCLRRYQDLLSTLFLFLVTLWEGSVFGSEDRSLNKSRGHCWCLISGEALSWCFNMGAP